MNLQTGDPADAYGRLERCFSCASVAMGVVACEEWVCCSASLQRRAMLQCQACSLFTPERKSCSGGHAVGASHGDSTLAGTLALKDFRLLSPHLSPVMPLHGRLQQAPFLTPLTSVNNARKYCMYSLRMGDEPRSSQQCCLMRCGGLFLWTLQLAMCSIIQVWQLARHQDSRCIHGW